MKEPPWGWPQGDWTEERTCNRCGETIPAKWRHYWRPCQCTYLPTNQPPHDPDPGCSLCEGSGYDACEPQDLSVLRHWGACAECGVTAFDLIGEHGPIEGSARHADGEQPDDHVVHVTPRPLVSAINDYLTRVAQ